MSMDTYQVDRLTEPPDSKWLRLSQLVQLSCQTLDDEDFAGWLSLFDAVGRYEVRVYSHELRREMTWLGNDVSEMQSLLDALPNHLRDPGGLMRVASLRSFDEGPDNTARTRSSVLVYKTDVYGMTSLFACGEYRDVWTHSPTGYRLRHRILDLKTRTLGVGSHVPL